MLQEAYDAIEVARKFIRGEASPADLYVYSLRCADTAARTGQDGEIATISRHWASLADSCRNEFGLHPDPISETLLRKTLIDELELFDAAIGG